MTAESPPNPQAGNLTSRTLQGVRWTYLSAGVGAVLQAVFVAVSARLVDDVAFGLMALALLTLRFGGVFARMGLGPAVVQRADLTDREIRAATVAGAALGLGFFGLVWIAAPFGAALFREPAVIPVLRAMGGTLVLTGFGLVAESLLRREMRFKELAYTSMFSYVMGYFGVGLTLAWLGAGVWALVAAALTQALLQTVTWYAVCRHPVKPVFEWEPYRNLLGFGSRVSFITFGEFLGNNLDTLAVGRYLSTALLGQYNRAFFLINLPLMHLTSNLAKVLFPSFSRIQHDLRRVRGAYLEAARLSAAVLIPMTAGMGVASPEFVHTALGDDWEIAVTLLPIFAVAAAFRFLSYFPAIVMEAIADLNKKLALQGIYIVVLGGLLLGASRFDLWAFAAALAMGEFLRNAAYIVITRRSLGVSARDIAGVYAPAFLSAAAVGGVIAIGRAALLEIGTPLWVVLLADVALGAVTLGLLFVFGPLRHVRAEVALRLRRSGMFGESGGLLSRVMQAALGAR